MTQFPAKMDDAGPETAGRLALLLCAAEEVHDLAASWLTEGGMSAISASAVDDARRRSWTGGLNCWCWIRSRFTCRNFQAFENSRKKGRGCAWCSLLALMNSLRWVSPGFRLWTRYCLGP
jgi:hypothetical protein